MSWNPESPAAAIAGVVAALEAMQVPWFMTGSMASGLHAIPRSTNDIDLVVDLPPERSREFVSAIGDGYYADATMIASSLMRRRASNVIWLDTMMKVDLMPPRFAFDHEAMRRRQKAQMSDGSEQVLQVVIATAEDLVLSKLWWYREGGETSQRQWTDVANLIRVKGSEMDRAYLESWAKHGGFDDLLSKALVDGNIS